MTSSAVGHEFDLETLDRELGAREAAFGTRLRTSDFALAAVGLAGACAAVTTFFAVKFLLRYFQTNRLTPFGIYCIVAGLGSIVYLQLIK